MSDHDSSWLRNGPCPDCGSSDALGHYSDGHTFCQSCHAYNAGENEETEADRLAIDSDDLVTNLSYRSLDTSGLSEKTCRLIGYAVAKVKIDGKIRPCHVSTYFKAGRAAAQHLRSKSSDGEKDFRWRGNPKGVELYGQHLWKNRSKKILVITEGEKDMGSYVEASEGKWACVSVPNGAQNAAKDIKPNLEFCNQYEKIVLMFDMDEAGRKAAEECVALFAPGRAAIAELPDGYKDANEMLLARKGSDLKWIPWNAEVWSPDEVTGGDDLLNDILEFMDDPDKGALEYPWPKLQELTQGCRVGEIVTVGAGTGVGKSEICRQIAMSLRMSFNEKIGYIALEESATTSAIDFMGLFKKLRLRLRIGEFSKDEIKHMYSEVIGKTGHEKFHFYKHFGSLESQKLLNRLRYMVQGCDCRTIVLDHISIAVSGNDSQNERKDIDVLMTSLRSLVEELGIRCIIVSHLKRLSDGSHEEGARVKLSDFRGSGSIAQLSDLVIGAERNQQSKEKSNLTRIRVLKNRWTGRLGEADLLAYDYDTGILSPATTDADEYFNQEGDEEPDF